MATMTDEEVGNLFYEIKALIYPLQEDQLNHICQELKVPLDPKGKGRLNLLRGFEKYLDVISQDKECVTLLKHTLKTVVTVSKPTYTVPQPPQPSIINNKELKITGIIHGTEGISFVNLIRQIEVAREKKYPDKEIIWAVVKAIHPSQQLRNYLEGKTDLTLPTLRKLLRAYYKERSASELYAELTEGCQGVREEVLDFVWRILDLGQKVSFATEEEGSILNYDQRLVRQMTLRSIQTGLRDESIALVVKDIITENPSDEELTTKINTIVSENEERRKKMSKTTKVRAVIAEEKEIDNGSEQQFSLLELKAEVKALRRELQQSKTNRRGCNQCREAGQKCDHCFICGSSEHFQAGCKQKKRQGNGTGSMKAGNH